MKFTSSAIAAILLLATTTTKTNSVEAFAFTPSLTRSHCIGSDSVTTTTLFLSPDHLTNAMAKTHEEKIRALKDIEDKKNAEIQVSGRDRNEKSNFDINTIRHST